MAKRTKISSPFRFPRKRHRRLHGPAGHKAYQAYKPWLRDEFKFRCVYCLTRELWHGNHYNFTIDHVKPKANHVELTCEYDNLVYACSTCNMLKSTRWGLPNPCRIGLGRYLKERSGNFIFLEPAGKRLIRYLRLNEPDRVRDRRRYLRLFEKWDRLSPEERLDTFVRIPCEPA